MFILLVCLVAVAYSHPQAPEGAAPPAPLPPPTWFLETTLVGTFGERSAQCEELFPKYKETASNGPIFIPEDSDADICINFPPRTLEDGRELKGGWRHDKGAKGACANGCCEFQPPTKAAPAKVDHPSWFETSSDCSDDKNVVKGAPILFKGKVKNIFFSSSSNLDFLFCHILLYPIPFYSAIFYSILYPSILPYSTLFYTLLFCHILLYSIPFYSAIFYSILYPYILPYSTLLFYTLLFCNILLYSIPFYSAILLYSIPFYSAIFFSILYPFILPYSSLFYNLLFCPIYSM